MKMDAERFVATLMTNMAAVTAAEVYKENPSMIYEFAKKAEARVRQVLKESLDSYKITENEAKEIESVFIDNPNAGIRKRVEDYRLSHVYIDEMKNYWEFDKDQDLALKSDLKWIEDNARAHAPIPAYLAGAYDKYYSDFQERDRIIAAVLENMGCGKEIDLENGPLPSISTDDVNEIFRNEYRDPSSYLDSSKESFMLDRRVFTARQSLSKKAVEAMKKDYLKNGEGRSDENVFSESAALLKRDQPFIDAMNEVLLDEVFMKIYVARAKEIWGEAGLQGLSLEAKTRPQGSLSSSPPLMSQNNTI